MVGFADDIMTYAATLKGYLKRRKGKRKNGAYK